MSANNDADPESKQQQVPFPVLNQSIFIQLNQSGLLVLFVCLFFGVRFGFVLFFSISKWTSTFKYQLTLVVNRKYYFPLGTRKRGISISEVSCSP